MNSDNHSSCQGLVHDAHLFSLLTVVFVCVLLVLFALMSWLVLAPVPFLRKLLKLYDIPDMNFKILLVALASLNFVFCFLLEVLYAEPTLGPCSKNCPSFLP